MPRAASSKALVEALNKRLAERVRVTSESVQADASNIIRVTNKGKFQYQGVDIGSSMDVVVLDTLFESVYFDTPFDPDNQTVDPTCWAIGRVANKLAPPADHARPQSEACATCEWNEYGSASSGRGKACRNYRRVCVVPWVNGAPDVDQVAILRLAPTSLGPFNRYLRHVIHELGRDTISLVTRFTVDDSVSWGQIRPPEEVDVIEDPAVLNRLLDVPAEAILENVGYTLTPPEREAKPAKPKRRSKLS